MGIIRRLFTGRSARPAAPATSPPSPAPVPRHVAAGIAKVTQDEPCSLGQDFTYEHLACDELWAAVEEAARSGGDVASAWKAFDADTRLHFQKEEQILFPAFERVSPMGGAGPTQVMRAEHDQMRGLLDQMGQAADSGDYARVVDLGDTLLLLTQQHNLKEEGMLYPMATDALAHEWTDLKAQLAAL